MIKSEVELKYNRTTRFIIPALRLNEPLMVENGLVNAYLTDHEYDIRWDYEGCIYLLFKPNQFDSKFEVFCEQLRKQMCYKDEYDVEDGVMMVLEIPKEYQSILKAFKQGKYSLFDRKYVKDCIPQYFKGNLSKKWKVLYKDKGLKEELEKAYVINIEDGELEDRPYAEDEIYRYNPEIETGLNVR